MIRINNLYLSEINISLQYNFKNTINFLGGDNGSGKTLLLDYIAGLRTSEKCSIDCGNQSLIYLRQNFSINNKLTVKEYISFILNLNGKSVDDFLAYLSNYQIDFPYKKNEKKRLGVLSGGERSFLYLLSILSIERDWYILDEPFNNLDLTSRLALCHIIESMHKNGKSFLLTSHIPVNLTPLNEINFKELLIPQN